MAILLIDPPRTPIGRGNIWKALKRNLPSLGLAYIAALLEKNGHKVKIIDMNADAISLDSLLNKVGEGNYKLVGITATTPQINSALIIAKEIKENYPDIKIVMGGPHPHVMFEDVLSHNFIDFVVRGEGEFTMLELAEGRNYQLIEGLSYKDGGKLINNPFRQVIKDLDILPYPARHLLPMEKYIPTAGSYKRLPATSVITSRGCPGKCTFCNTDIFGRTLRFRSGENIAGEIATLIEKYKIKEISFYDDTFTISNRNVKKLCYIIIDERMDITWSCFSRIDFVDADLLKLMKKAGCHSVCYGIESAEEMILSNIKKKINLSLVPDVIKWTRNAGIESRVCFMLGNPGETEKTLQRNLEYAISLNPDIFIFNITTPFPGTEMFNWAKDNGYLKTLNWDEYDLGRMVMDLPTIRSETVEKYYKISYTKAYLRPRYIIHRLSKIRSFSSFTGHARVFKDMVLSIVFNR